MYAMRLCKCSGTSNHRNPRCGFGARYTRAEARSRRRAKVSGDRPTCPAIANVDEAGEKNAGDTESIDGDRDTSRDADEEQDVTVGRDTTKSPKPGAQP